MATRVSSAALLVGSLPTPSTDASLRAGARLLGDRLFALPDGESGPRSAWVGYDRTHLLEPHPDIAVVTPGGSPARHPYDTADLTLRPGVTELRFEQWPRVPETLESYRRFAALRAAGEIPAGLRFQVGLPFPSSVLTAAFKHDHAGDAPIVAAALEDLWARSIDALLAEIPAGDLALQWDCAYETLDLEGVLAWTSGDAWDRFAGPVERLTRRIPDDVVVGYHLCYGTFPEWPTFEARGMSVLVRMANHAVAASGRPVDWLHLAGPRSLRSEEDAFFAPLADLDAALLESTRVYLGIVLPVDGVAGLRRRHATASRHLADFGVAMYCGFGRQPGEDPEATLREHAETIAAVRG